VFAYCFICLIYAHSIIPEESLALSFYLKNANNQIRGKAELPLLRFGEEIERTKPLRNPDNREVVGQITVKVKSEKSVSF
jgi:hypothetical protein